MKISNPSIRTNESNASALILCPILFVLLSYVIANISINMLYKCQIWPSHPCHDEVLWNGRKRLWKTGLKPVHLERIRVITEELAELISNHNEAVLNDSSKKPTMGDYLWPRCFAKEQNFLVPNEETHMAINCSKGIVKFKLS